MFSTRVNSQPDEYIRENNICGILNGTQVNREVREVNLLMHCRILPIIEVPDYYSQQMSLLVEIPTGHYKIPRFHLAFLPWNYFMFRF